MNIIANIPPSGKRRRVVIVGGGFGGLKLARELDRDLFQVVLLDRQNYHQFQPLLYQVATAGLEPSSIAFPFRKIFQKSEAFYFRLCEVNMVFSEKKTVDTDIGLIDYDLLVIATGGSTNFFGNIKLKEQAMTLKSIPEALSIRNHLLQSIEEALNSEEKDAMISLMTFLIVGGGATGVELAGALAEMKKYILPKDYPELDPGIMTVTLIDASPRLLGSMSIFASENALKYLKKLGVNVILNTQVKEYTGDTVILGNDLSMKAANVFWVAGIQGNNLNGLEDAITEKGLRLNVDQFGRVLNHSDIFAIGDTCLMKTEKYPGGHPQVAQVAIQQGRLLAKNLKRQIRGKPLKRFEYSDKGYMATVGRNLAVADLKHMKFGGFTAWALWLFVHLMSIVGTKNRLFIFLNWMWSYITFDQSLRLVIKQSRH